MKNLVVYIVLSLSVLTITAQDAQFSQYFASPALINPAVPGIIPEIEFSANYKAGGDESKGTFLEVMQASISYPLRKKNHTKDQLGAVGASFFRENRGYQRIYTSQKLLLTGAYTLKLSEFNNHFIVFGLQGGIIQNQLNTSLLRWGSQHNQFFGDGYDDSLPGELLTNEAIYYPTFNFGVIYTLYDNDDYYIRDRSFTFGVSADNLNQPITGSNELGQVKRDILLKGFGYAKMELTSRFYLYPSFLLLNIESSFQVNGGFYLSTALQSPRAKTSMQLHIGSWYRINDSFIFLGGLQVDHIRISGSLDLNASQFQNNDLWGPMEPTYEISLTYNFVSKITSRRISNPIF